jgi:hypothetical protein
LTLSSTGPKHPPEGFVATTKNTNNSFTLKF